MAIKGGHSFCVDAVLPFSIFPGKVRGHRVQLWRTPGGVQGGEVERRQGAFWAVRLFIEKNCVFEARAGTHALSARQFSVKLRFEMGRFSASKPFSMYPSADKGQKCQRVRR